MIRATTMETLVFRAILDTVNYSVSSSSTRALLGTRGSNGTISAYSAIAETTELFLDGRINPKFRRKTCVCGALVIDRASEQARSIDHKSLVPITGDFANLVFSDCTSARAGNAA